MKDDDYTSFEREIQAMTMRTQLDKIMADDFGGDRVAAVLMWAADVFEHEAGKHNDGTSGKMHSLEWAATFWTSYVLRVSQIDVLMWDSPSVAVSRASQHLRLLSGGAE